MRKGDIVRLKGDHYLCPLIKGNCHITEVHFVHSSRKTRYHITNSEGCMTWVYEEELDLVSDLREQIITSLGI